MAIVLCKLLLVIGLAVIPIGRAGAIGIELERVQFGIGHETVEAEAPFSRFHVDNEAFPFVNPNYSFDWLFSNTEQRASLDGYWYMRGGELYSSATVAFSLSEPASFLVTGNIRQPEWLETSFTSLAASLGEYSGFGSELDQVASPFPGLSGILNAGAHVFAVSGYAFNTESNSEVHLLLRPVGVADGGGTLLLLGVGLLGICVVRACGVRVGKVCCLLVLCGVLAGSVANAGWDPLERKPAPEPVPPYRPIK